MSTVVRQVLRGRRGMPLLLGAGASLAAGAASGQQIARHLTRVLGHGAPDDHSAAQFTFEQMTAQLGGGDITRGQQLSDWIAGLEPTPGHRALAKLVRDGVLGPIVLTSNFDNLIEQALNFEAVQFVTIYPEDYDSETEILEPDKVCVVKLHGDLERSRSIKTTPADVLRFPQRFESWLASLIAEHGLLAIGHRLEDPDFLNTLDQIEMIRSSSFVVEPNDVTDGHRRLLALSKSEANHHRANFDEFFVELESAFRLGVKNDEARDELNRRWLHLRELRERGGPLNYHKEDNSDETLAEESALKYLFQYESSARSMPQLVDMALDKLDEAVKSSEPIATLHAELRLRRAAESLNAILAGTYARGTGSRYDALIDCLAEFRALRDDPLTTRDALLRARVLLGLGEAAKEAYTSTPGRAGSEKLLEEARDALNEVEKFGERATEASDEIVLLGACASRHAAAVHEYLGARSVRDEEKRRHLELWLSKSESAAAKLESLPITRAYALMNFAQASIRLETEARGSEISREAAVAAWAVLVQSRELFGRTNDFRGCAWSEMNLARLAVIIARSRAAVPALGTSAEDCWAVAAMHASAARVWALRAGPDNLVVGLASYYEAFALSERGFGANWAQVRIRAEEAEASLRTSHRIPQAARAALIQAEALRMLSVVDDNPVAKMGQAIERAANAISLLCDSGAISGESASHCLKTFTRILEAELSDVY